ncbi:MAG TPA: hypothetical protein GX529_10355, partial [Firmicutes bacterium]|nr:hypothetical protein [Candidatus Fermentithermobacillaceae bacterium]
MIELLITHPPSYEPERRYIYEVMFGEFLGLTYKTKVGDEPYVTVISVRDDPSEKRLIVCDALFAIELDKWLTEDSLPRQQLDRWILPHTLCDMPKVSSEIPVIYGRSIEGDSYYAERDGNILLGLDVFGSVFFMLTRYEEVVKSDRDEHRRFPAAASLAYQEGFLERPIVNEYVEILWGCMKQLWPYLQRKSHCYQLHLTHDVDYPRAVAGKPWHFVFRDSLADVVKRKDVGLACRRIHARRLASQGNFARDPYNTFDLLMDISERHAINSAFYFTAHESCDRLDSDYSIQDLWIRKLLVRISEHGHEIGFHGSYHSYNNRMQVAEEVERFRQVLREEGIDQDILGGRQHYLRWECPTTWDIWDQLGMDYDSTLGFADCVGFRCGTCYEYPVFDLVERQSLNLRERPLIVMERSLMSAQFAGLFL